MNYEQLQNDNRSENQIVADILQNFAELARLDRRHQDKIYVWQNKTGASKYADPSRRSGYRFIRFGKVGSADIIGSFHGKFLAIEVKRPTKRSNTTEFQRGFLDAIKATGAHAFVATSWSDCEKELDL